MKGTYLGILATLSLSALAALAQTPTNPNGTPVTGQTIQERKDNQQQRIGNGVENGSLTAGEAGKLETKEQNLNKEERNMRAADGGKSAVDEDLAFHRAIAEATGNPEFARFLQFIGRHLIPRRTVSGLPERMGGERAYLALIQEEHRRIYEAIEGRDAKGAREAMRRHLTRSLERYRKLAAEQARSRPKAEQKKAA